MAFPLGGDPPLWDVLIKECYWRFWFKTDKESSGKGCDRQEGAYHNTNGNNSRKPFVVFYCGELRSKIGSTSRTQFIFNIADIRLKLNDVHKLNNKYHKTAVGLTTGTETRWPGPS